MNKIKTLLVALVLGFSSRAQNFDFENYQWNEELTSYRPTDAEKDLPEIGLQDKRVIELVVEDDQAIMYSMSHIVKYLNSQDAIERNNKIYLPVSYNGEVQKQMARVINPDGKIVELDQDDILDATDESTGKKYKYFALEGLELGSTMEYISITKFIPSLNGATYTFQSSYLKKNVSFDVYYPIHLVFEYKSYNGFPKMEQDTTSDGFNHFFAHTDEIEALDEEDYQNYDASLKEVSYKLTGNHYSKKYNLNGFSSFASNIYEALYPVLDKKEIKIIDKFLSEAKLDYARNEEDKIRKIEDFIKTKIAFIEESKNAPSTILEIDAQRTASEFGLVLLYVQMLKAADIKVELVGTCNRFESIFDKEFENMNHLEEFALFFPEYKTYLAPTQTFHRYPLIPYQWTENYGLFIKSVELGGVTMGSGKTKYIETTDMKDSQDSISINIDFSSGMDELKYQYFRSYTGYDAVFNQSIFSYITSEEDKKELREELVKTLDESMEIENLSTKNEGAEFLNKSPYEMSCTFTSDAFVEKAGKNYLLKIGELIGPQVEMYDTKERKSEIEFSFTKVYSRTISFTIPEGYTLKNIDKCKEDFVYKDEDGKVILGFVTSYEIKGNKVVIQNKEFYNKVRMSIDPYYVPFRKVVNAAADFNKIILVLEAI